MNWKIPVLASYFYLEVKEGSKLNSALRKHCEHFDIIVDSGAFTAFKSGGKISMDKYCDYLKKMKFPAEFYFTLDEIGNSEQTYSNFMELRKRGFKPVPIFTRGDSIELFHKYRGICDLVGIGGIAGTEKSSNYLKYLLEDNKLSQYKTHWLGFWDKDFLSKYKPTSCDTTSWQHFVMFGRALVYHNRKFYAFGKKDFKKLRILNPFCEKYGINYDLFFEEEVWRNMAHPVFTPNPQVISALSFLLFNRDCMRFLGTKVYLVCSYGRQIELLMYCKEKFGKFLTI